MIHELRQRTTDPYYAIQTIRGSLCTVYVIRRICGDDISPACNGSHETLEAAQAAAHEMGVEIKAIGDIWQIIGK